MIYQKILYRVGIIRMEAMESESPCRLNVFQGVINKQALVGIGSQGLKHVLKTKRVRFKMAQFKGKKEIFKAMEKGTFFQSNLPVPDVRIGTHGKLNVIGNAVN